MLEENINIVNEIIEEEENQRKKDEEAQSASMPDTSSMMKGAQNMTSNMQMPKF
mgnify:FL=1